MDECVPPQYQKARPFGVVKDTLMSNGKSYAQIQGSWIEYQRFEDRRVFFYDSKSETEYLLFDFNATPGTMVATHIRGNDTTDIKFNNVYSDSIRFFNRAGYLWSFYVDWDRRTYDEETNYVIADSIGIISMSGYMFCWQLQGAIIADDTLGRISGVSGRSDIITTGYQLFQNYPNPFNPSTRIKFILPKAQTLKLQVYNTLGQTVRILIEDRVPAGSHEVEFNASHLPSGVYFYKLQTGGYTDVKEMIVLK